MIFWIMRCTKTNQVPTLKMEQKETFRFPRFLTSEFFDFMNFMIGIKLSKIDCWNNKLILIIFIAKTSGHTPFNIIYRSEVEVWTLRCRVTHFSWTQLFKFTCKELSWLLIVNSFLGYATNRPHIFYFINYSALLSWIGRLSQWIINYE